MSSIKQVPNNNGDEALKNKCKIDTTARKPCSAACRKSSQDQELVCANRQVEATMKRALQGRPTGTLRPRTKRPTSTGTKKATKKPSTGKPKTKTTKRDRK
jgi:hypothetical protein